MLYILIVINMNKNLTNMASIFLKMVVELSFTEEIKTSILFKYEWTTIILIDFFQ